MTKDDPQEKSTKTADWHSVDISVVFIPNPSIYREKKKDWRQDKKTKEEPYTTEIMRSANFEDNSETAAAEALGGI